MNDRLLLAGVEVNGRPDRCVLLAGGRIAAVGGPELAAATGPQVPRLAGGGGALIPGLNDHHLHLFAMAAADRSVRCGPPDVTDATALGSRLRAAAAAEPPGGWVRGIGYDPDVVGALSAAELDALMGALRDRPTRISHRSGHAWLLNTQARLRLGLDPAGGLLLEADDLLRHRLERDFPDLTAVSARLARTGITAVTDAGVHNGPVELAALRAASARGELRQRCLVLGTEALTKGSAAPAVEPGLDGLHDIDGLDSNGMVAVGPVKIVLAESDLPGLDELVRRIRAAGDRGVAVHAVSRESLVLAAVALAASAPAPETAGRRPRPRVEHASVAPPEIVALLRDSRARVVTQPGFVHQHGDRYRRTVDAEDQPWLYRLRAWIEAGMELSAGSDAPYGPDDPWLAMRAAVHRRTAGGRVLGAAEALTPEQALGLFSASPGLSAGPGPAEPGGGRPRSPAVGDPADLCLLQLPWRQAREELSADLVRATVIDGRIVWSSSTSST